MEGCTKSWGFSTHGSSGQCAFLRLQGLVKNDSDPAAHKDIIDSGAAGLSVVLRSFCLFNERRQSCRGSVCF